MNIYLVNESTVVSDGMISKILPALTTYTRHIRSWWGSMQPGLFLGKPQTDKAWQIVITNDADQAGALGYHDVAADGRPISFVFAGVAEEYGMSWQVTLTHELAEMLLDPYIMRCEQTGQARFHALELCDPVEADNLGYEIKAGGVSILASDFVTPYWFVPTAKGTYDHMGHCTKPLQVLKGGYAYIWEDGEWQSEDHLGRRQTVPQFTKKNPNKTRLAQYARPR